MPLSYFRGRFNSHGMDHLERIMMIDQNLGCFIAGDTAVAYVTR